MPMGEAGVLGTTKLTIMVKVNASSIPVMVEVVVDDGLLPVTYFRWSIDLRSPIE